MLDISLDLGAEYDKTFHTICMTVSVAEHIQINRKCFVTVSCAL